MIVPFTAEPETLVPVEPEELLTQPTEPTLEPEAASLEPEVGCSFFYTTFVVC